MSSSAFCPGKKTPGFKFARGYRLIMLKKEKVFPVLCPLWSNMGSSLHSWIKTSGKDIGQHIRLQQLRWRLPFSWFSPRTPNNKFCLLLVKTEAEFRNKRRVFPIRSVIHLQWTASHCTHKSEQIERSSLEWTRTSIMYPRFDAFC